MRLVLLGMPGAGKGTLGERIAEKYGLPHISTGSIMREVLAADGDLGRQVNSYVTKGDLVPDELMITVVKERIQKPDCAQGWLLDGFPRTVRQARSLDQLLAPDQSAAHLALEVRVFPAEVIRRITQRRVCSQCGAIYSLKNLPGGREVCEVCGGKLYRRVDDSEETIKKRLSVYMKQTHPVVHYYAGSGRLFSAEGTGSVDEVFARIEGILEGLVAKQTAGGRS